MIARVLIDRIADDLELLDGLLRADELDRRELQKTLDRALRMTLVAVGELAA